jgi:hypothetical protein
MPSAKNMDFELYGNASFDDWLILVSVVDNRVTLSVAVAVDARVQPRGT